MKPIDYINIDVPELGVTVSIYREYFEDEYSGEERYEWVFDAQHTTATWYETSEIVQRVAMATLTDRRINDYALEALGHLTRELERRGYGAVTEIVFQ